MELVAPGSEEEAVLWRRFRQDGDAAARQALVACHLPCARTVAAVCYRRRLNDEVEFGDYLQLACVGLLESLDRYDPARGVQFRTFAARRMHGAILNGLEGLTEKLQQIAARQRLRAERLQDAKAQALQPHGDPARRRQPAQLADFVAEVGIGLALCWMLEGTGLVDAGEGSTAAAYEGVALRQLRERLLRAVDDLPGPERTVIRSHYLQEISFEAVAQSLQLTRGRVSQIHRQALQRLRGLVRECAEWEASF